MVTPTRDGAAAAQPPPAAGMLASLGLGTAMAASNVLGYVFLTLLSRALGPDQFGAFSAVNNVGVLLAIPAGAIQVVVARHQRQHEGVTGLRAAVAIGSVLALTGSLAAPLGRHVFHLETPLPVVLVAWTLLPLAVTGAFQGILLGQGRLGALSAVHLVTAAGRVVVGVVTLVEDLTLDAALAGVLLATFVTCGVGGVLTRAELAGRQRGIEAHILPGVWRSNWTLASLVALSSTDVLLARHFLPAEEAGHYALASVFAKGVFWGTQFVALVIVPKVQEPGARRTTLRAAAAVLTMGALATGVVAAGAEPLLELTGGPAYTAAADLLIPFTILGTLLALAQVLLYADMAQDRTLLGWVVGAMTVVEVVLVAWRHADASQVLQAALATAAIAVLVGLARALRHGPRPQDSSG